MVPAAGQSLRMGGSVRKPFLEIHGRPLIVHTLEALARSESIQEIVWVAAEEDLPRAPRLLSESGLERRVRAAAGGSSRQESVYRGLLALRSDAEYALVHDGARPNVSQETIRRCLEGAAECGAASSAVPVNDALWSADSDLFIGASVSREQLWRAQTPQAFRRELLLRAHESARAERFEAPDDAGLVARLGEPVKLTAGDERNLKATAPDDLDTLRRLTAGETRVGIGWDVHRLEEGRRLILGGVEIAHTHGLVGHSDADVLAHAVCDALLGAACMGDIGTLFPDKDPVYLGADSIKLLREAADQVRRRIAPIYLDCTVKAERPRLRPYIKEMRKRLAEALGLPAERVSIKAKTGEGVGPVGRGEAIEAEAAVTALWQGGQEGAALDGG